MNEAHGDALDVSFFSAASFFLSPMDMKREKGWCRPNGNEWSMDARPNMGNGFVGCGK